MVSYFNVCTRQLLRDNGPISDECVQLHQGVQMDSASAAAPLLNRQGYAATAPDWLQLLALDLSKAVCWGACSRSDPG